ncbi:hypothetical protein [Alkalibacterium sp. MB6]|uniref:hypothetical protein n=1 Tax=Alkalibacterium sp. MB6 TaxID=2081965 RepID=UPI00137B275A|nr:hypothetical protein [Alkalibacterium sp. MB6]
MTNNKDGELKRPNHNVRDMSDPVHESPVSPDTAAPLGYIKDRPARDKLSEEEIDRKALGEAPGNDVELSLNPNEEDVTEDDVLDD